MKIEKIKDIFTNYVSKYDMNDKEIMMKYNHTFRVMKYCEEIAINNNFSQNEIEISMIIGLLHDYARFAQWIEYKTFSDILSIDHADLAVKLLFENNEIENFEINKEYYPIIKDAIKYHNKVVVPEEVDENHKKFCHIVRDADKLDIFYLFTLNHDCLKEDDKVIDKEIENEFFKENPIYIKKIKNESEHMLLHLSMIYNYKYNYSLKWMKDNKYIDKMFENVIRKEKFKKYFGYIKKYIDERNG